MDKSELCYVCRRKMNYCQKVKQFKNKTLCQICFNQVGKLLPSKVMSELFAKCRTN